MRRVTTAVIVALATVSCGRLHEDARPGASGRPAEDSRITAACGEARFLTLPPDPSAFPPFDGWGDVDLSEIGTEAEFFDAYTWSIAEETVDRLQLFGTSKSGDTAEPRYASAGFEAVPGKWKPIGWGECRIELSAPGWGNARFILDPDSPPEADASTVSILATEMACAGGQVPAGRGVRAIVLDQTAESVAIVVLVEPTEGDTDCQSNPSFPVEVDLPSALGKRHVLDASVYPPIDVSIASSETIGPTTEPQPATTPPGTPTGPTHPRPDPGVPLGPSEDRLPILIAVLRSLVEDEGVPLYVNAQLCLGEETATNCPDRLSAQERAAIVAAFPRRELHFIEGTDVGGDKVFDGRAQVAWLGPPMVADDRIQVVGGTVCGGLCGHGSVWAVEERADGRWEVTGPAPGYGQWVA